MPEIASGGSFTPYTKKSYRVGNSGGWAQGRSGDQKQDIYFARPWRCVQYNNFVIFHFQIPPTLTMIQGTSFSDVCVLG